MSRLAQIVSDSGEVVRSTVLQRTVQPGNPGVPLDLSAINAVRINTSAAERRVASLPGRRSIKQDAQAGWLLNAVCCMDLTTLNGDDTPGRIKRLCAKARHPIRDDILAKLGMRGRSLTTGAVCVYHQFVASAVEALSGSVVVKQHVA